MKHARKNSIYFVPGDVIILMKSKSNINKDNIWPEILANNVMWTIKISLHYMIIVEIFLVPVKKMDWTASSTVTSNINKWDSARS